MPERDVIQSRIRKTYQHLPANQQKIADFIMGNMDLVPFLSVHDLAKAAMTSVSSVVRFAQRNGYEGYLDMREKIAQSLQSRLKTAGVFTVAQRIPQKGDTLATIAHQDVNNINETLTLIERDHFRRAVDLILDARQVYTAGLGISYLLSQILAYQLNQVGIDAHPFKHGSTIFSEQVLFLKKEDLVVAFSFPPYSQETIEVAKQAHDRRLHVVSITNKSTAPITFYSTQSLIVKSENMLFTNSFAAISVLINAISTECALRNKNKAETMLRNLNEALSAQIYKG